MAYLWGDPLRLAIASVDGVTNVEVTSSGGAAALARWAPDGSRLAFRWEEQSNGHRLLYTCLPDGTDIRQISTTAAPAGTARFVTYAWSPVAPQLLYQADAVTEGIDELYVAAADGTGEVHISAESGTTGGVLGSVDDNHWTGDGLAILYLRVGNNADDHLFWNDVDGQSPRQVSPDNEGDARVYTTFVDRVGAWMSNGPVVSSDGNSFGTADTAGYVTDMDWTEDAVLVYTRGASVTGPFEAWQFDEAAGTPERLSDTGHEVQDIEVVGSHVLYNDFSLDTYVGSTSPPASLVVLSDGAVASSITAAGPDRAIVTHEDAQGFHEYIEAWPTTPPARVARAFAGHVSNPRIRTPSQQIDRTGAAQGVMYKTGTATFTKAQGPPNNPDSFSYDLYVVVQPHDLTAGTWDMLIVNRQFSQVATGTATDVIDVTSDVDVPEYAFSFQANELDPQGGFFGYWEGTVSAEGEMVSTYGYDDVNTGEPVVYDVTLPLVGSYGD